MLKRMFLGSALLVFFAGGAPADDLFGMFQVESDGLLPMETILAQARATAEGTITEIELERKKGVWVYEVDVVLSNRQKIELLFDARTGKLLSRKRERD